MTDIQRPTGTPEAENTAKPRPQARGIARNLERGLVIVNTGDGKGKSTASFGVVARAVGQGLKCLVVQFIKGNWSTGEQQAMRQLGVEMYQMGYGFIRIRPSHKTEAEHFAQMQATFAFAKEKTATDAYDLLVLDEACFAMSLGGLDPGEVTRWLASPGGEPPRRLSTRPTWSLRCGRSSTTTIVASAPCAAWSFEVVGHFLPAPALPWPYFTRRRLPPELGPADQGVPTAGRIQ